MKKFICILLVVCLSLACFAACGDKKPAENKVDVDIIEVWTNDGAGKEFMEKAVADWNASVGKEKGIEIDYQVLGADFATVFDNAMATDQVPEITTCLGGKLPGFLNQDKFMYFDEMPGGDELSEGMEAYAQEMRTVMDGRWFTLPYKTTTIGLFYNKDMFKAAGIVDANGEALPPATWDEFYEVADKLTDPAKGQYGVAIPMKWGAWSDWDLIRHFCGTNGQAQYDFVNDCYDFEGIRSCFEYLERIAADKSYFPGPESLDNDPARAQFSAGTVGMKMAVAWDIGVLTSQFPAEIDWGVAPVPVEDPDNRYGQYAESPGRYMFPRAAMTDDNIKAKSMEVFKWLNSEELFLDLYEAGLVSPYDQSIMDKSTQAAEDFPKGFAEFADSSKAAFYPQFPSVSVEGETYPQVMMKVFQGTVSIDDAIADLDARYNKALDEAVKAGKLDLADFHTPATGELVK